MLNNKFIDDENIYKNFIKGMKCLNSVNLMFSDLSSDIDKKSL